MYILGIHITALHVALALWVLLTAIGGARAYFVHRGDPDWTRATLKSDVILAASGSAIFLMLALFVTAIVVVCTIPNIKTTQKLLPLHGKPYYVASRVSEDKRWATININGRSVEVSGSPSVYYSKDERNPRIEVSKTRLRAIDKLFWMDEMDQDIFTTIYVPALDKDAIWFNEMRRKVSDLDGEIADLDKGSTYSSTIPAALIAEQRRLVWSKVHSLAVERDLNAEIYNSEAAKASETDFHIQVDYPEAAYQIPVKYQNHWSVATTPTP